MVDGVGVEGVNQAQVVSDGGEVRQQLVQPDPALALAGELEHRGGDELLAAAGHRGHPLSLAHRLGQFFLEELVQVRLVIEEVELARGAGHEEEDDALRPRRVVELELFRGARPGYQRGVGGGAKTHAGAQQESSSGLEVHSILRIVGHGSVRPIRVSS